MGNRYVIDDLRHEIGGHCESTTMRNLIRYAGINNITEEMVFGLDSTLGFVFFDYSQGENTENSFMGIPLFIGGKQGSITQKSLGCQILGFDISFETFSSREVAWESTKNWLNQNIPLGIQLDMGMLSYFDWEEEIHFGGHFITLIGYDEEIDQVFIYDNGFDTLQRATIDELMNTRSSKFGPSFLHPKYRQFHVMKRNDGRKPPFARAAKLALQQVAQQMLHPSMNYNGLPALNLFAQSIPKWPQILEGTMKSEYSDEVVSKSELTFEMIYGLIEEMGTGGAIFRNLYSKFLKELSIHPEIIEGPHAWNEEERYYLESAWEDLTNSAKLWNSASAQIKQALDEGKENCLDYIDLQKLEGSIIDIIPLEESCFKNLLQIKLR
ncbi:MAG: DUF4872 domain-containing protein [Candidatus Heimdallarchaeota archaeon]|nr:MAG: DUF4872 domain-containing protein [Candidatus Heimdallarchaeota archaeon]